MVTHDSTPLERLKSKAETDAAEAALEASIKTASAKARAEGHDFFKDLLHALRAASVPQTEIDKLTKALDVSTDKNRTLAHVMTTASRVAAAVKAIL